MRSFLTIFFIFAFSLIAQAASFTAPPKVISDIDPDIIKTINIRLSNHLDNLKVIPDAKREPIIKSETTQATQPFGYYSPKIEYFPQNNTLTVELGPQTTIRTIQIQTTNTIKEQLQDEIVTLKNKFMHKPFTSKEYSQLKNKLIELLRNDGYRNATIHQPEAILSQPNKEFADINVTFKLGPQFTISDIHFVGDSLAPSFLMRFNPIPINSPYNQTLIQQLRDNLNESGLFSSVIIREMIDGKTIPLTVEYQTVPKYQYSIGLGYNSNQKIKEVKISIKNGKELVFKFNG